MKPSLHTLLINYVIGLCKKTKHRPTVLADLGYKIEVIEQRIRTSKGDAIKPDMILATKQNPPHALIIECKGGITVNGEQLEKYKDITNDGFVHWLTVHSREQLKFDVCLIDSASNHDAVKQYNNNFPIITFENNQITKSKTFTRKELNEKFATPISLQGMAPPIDYYPFSENDDLRIIVPHVLQALVSLAVQKGRGGQTVLDESVFSHEDMLRRVHQYWDVLSEDIVVC